MYPFMIKRNSCKSHFLQRTGQHDEHTRGMNFHTTKKALTMVHPVDEQEEVNPIAVPPEIFLMGEFVTCVPQIYFFFSMCETVRDCFRIHVQYLLIRFLLPIYSHYLTVLFL
jgi:hypothetical protein